ncbi:Threonine/homoserine efflux transporter RhtA [Mucilaginibacter pineti]|uniref:Threonine/homoserine efflux transporter RhtA n=1 Tax=Mucilaginibacter pineti TaxID=1391627 RepID=A0A1G7D3D6_9SPHI|nr:DMT family transporter [Mucilaginibacter pineti]SDE46003.1 Threonine/homoserine efflux transporter RhtA [Mucilaginibacter pineti]
MSKFAAMTLNPKISLIIGILCISFSPIFVKLAGVSPIGCAFYRVFFAWLCLLPYCIIKKKLNVNSKQLIIAVIAGVVFAADVAVWNFSLLKISATVSTLIANLAPVWVGLISFLLFRKKSGTLFWIGTLIAIVGMIVLVGYQHILHLEFNEGILLATLASLFYATYILITKNIMAHIDVFTFMFYSMASASIFLVLVNGVMGNSIIDFPLNVWLCFIGMGVICQLVGWLTINYSLRYMESTRVAVMLLSQTVFAGILAGFLLNERLGLNEIIGSVIVLAGIAVTFLKPRNQLNKSVF